MPCRGISPGTKTISPFSTAPYDTGWLARLAGTCPRRPACYLQRNPAGDDNTGTGRHW
jgi:hypothetical protein